MDTNFFCRLQTRDWTILNVVKLWRSYYHYIWSVTWLISEIAYPFRICGCIYKVHDVVLWRCFLYYWNFFLSKWSTRGATNIIPSMIKWSSRTFRAHFCIMAANSIVCLSLGVLRKACRILMLLSGNSINRLNLRYLSREKYPASNYCVLRVYIYTIIETGKWDSHFFIGKNSLISPFQNLRTSNISGNTWCHLNISHDGNIIHLTGLRISTVINNSRPLLFDIGACRRCSNYTLIVDLTTGFNELGEDNRKTSRDTFKVGIWFAVY